MQQEPEPIELSSIFIIMSTLFLITYLVVVLPLRYHQNKKSLQRVSLRKSDWTPSKVIQHSANQTIFEYLDLLTTNNTEIAVAVRESSNSRHTKERLDYEQPPLIVKKNLSRIAKQQNLERYYQTQRNMKAEQEFSGVVICDCYDCCCQGCPWQISTESSISIRIKNWIESIQNIFFQNQKMIAFFIINLGSYAYLPLNNLLYFTRSLYLIYIGGLIFTSFEFFVLIFTLSFINTRREMVRLEKHNQIQRALLMYYHLKKAVILTFIYSLLLSASTYVIYNFHPPTMDPFEYLNQYYNVLTNINLLILMKFTGCLSNDLISDDDRILKAQQRLHALQNNLIKYFPSEEVWYQYLAKQIEQKKNQSVSEDIDSKQNVKSDFLDNDQELKNDLVAVLDYNCTIAKEKLQMHMSVIDSQKYQKIKKNLGTQKCQITFLTIYIYFNCIGMLIVSILRSLVFIDGVEQNQVIKFFVQFSNDQLHSITLIYYVFVTLQYILLPYLIGKMCNKKALLGQDYGQKYQSVGQDLRASGPSTQQISMQQT